MHKFVRAAKSQHFNQGRYLAHTGSIASWATESSAITYLVDFFCLGLQVAFLKSSPAVVPPHQHSSDFFQSLKYANLKFLVRDLVRGVNVLIFESGGGYRAGRVSDPKHLSHE